MIVTINPGCFSKRYDKDEFPAELAKAQLMYQHSLRSEFIAPAVLDADEATGTIHYQRLEWTSSLLDVLAEQDRSRASLFEVLERVGSSLAAIHEITPPNGAAYGRRSALFTRALMARSTSSQQLRTAALATHGRTGVLQHGDFGFTNIFVTESAQIVVIDPSPNQYVSTHPLNVDVPELDLSVLMSHLIGRSSRPRALGRSIMFGRPMVETVMEGYQRSGAEIDRDRLRNFTRAGIDAVRAYKSAGSRAHRRAILKPLAAVLVRNLS